MYAYSTHIAIYVQQEYMCSKVCSTYIAGCVCVYNNYIFDSVCNSNDVIYAQSRIEGEKCIRVYMCDQAPQIHKAMDGCSQRCQLQ